MEMNVNYSWKPKICTICQSFGHSMEKFSRNAPLPPSVKVPLPRPNIKWVPKVSCPPVSDRALAMGPAIESPTVSIFDDEVIDWEPDKSSGVHKAIEMRYDMQLYSYHMFLGGHEEIRRLVYHVEGEGLSLTTTAIDGARNWWQFLDRTWDQIYLYSSVSRSYDPKLATYFFAVQHVIGLSTDVDISNDRGACALPSSLVSLSSSYFSFLPFVLSGLATIKPDFSCSVHV